MHHEINQSLKFSIRFINTYKREISLINYEVRNTTHLFFFIVSENNSPTLEKHATTHSLNIAPFHFSN